MYSKANNPSWSSNIEQTFDFATDPDIFDILLGTRIGKTISYLVLGSFFRGTRHIARIVTVMYYANTFHLQFDIEPIG